jgi:hypothetical protein
MPSRCNCLFIVYLFICPLTTCFGLTGHLHVLLKGTAVRCNAVFLLRRPQVTFGPCVCGSLVTTAWRVLKLRLEETASGYGG